MKKGLGLGISVILVIILLVGCSDTDQEPVAAAEEENRFYAYDMIAADYEPIAPHKGLNQEPVPVKLERIGPNEVNLEMTAQITEIEISPGINYSAWTFNGEAPGPVVVVKEGKTFMLYTQIQKPDMRTSCKMKREPSGSRLATLVCSCITVQRHLSLRI